jgi:hypothetical protein
MFDRSPLTWRDAAVFLAFMALMMFAGFGQQP